MTATAARSERIAGLGYDYAARELEPVPACNLCGSEHHVEVSRTDRYGFPQRFVSCALCGLGFLSPRLTAGEYARFYDSVYRPLVSAYHGRRIDAETVQDEQREYAAELVEFLRAALPAAPATLLDVGGSTGIVADAVRREFGTAATVLDPAPDELAVAAAAGMETIAGFAEDADYGGRTFELVLLCQTIDHLLDVAATLAAIRRVLAPDGRAFVDVLDVAFMTRRRGSIEGAVKVDHPYYLTRATALAYFRQAGLEPTAERLSEDGHWGFVLAPAQPAEPDWEALAIAAEFFLAEVWRLRAGS
jgi:SAM-dependent methyltransferase